MLERHVGDPRLIWRHHIRRRRRQRSYQIAATGRITAQNHKSPLSNNLPLTLGLRFVGDLGADVLVVFGTASEIEFSGGADADVLTIGSTGAIGDISFEGDLGAGRVTSLRTRR